MQSLTFALSIVSCKQAGDKKCDGRCVDVMTDEKNCGRCGRHCKLSQTCRAGTCTARPSCTDNTAFCINHDLWLTRCHMVGASEVLGTAPGTDLRECTRKCDVMGGQCQATSFELSTGNCIFFFDNESFTHDPGFNSAYYDEEDC